MAIEMHAAPEVAALAPAPARVDDPDPARAGVIFELTDGGRLGDLDKSDDLVDHEDWAFFKAIWHIDPKLVWIAWWSTGYAEGEPNLAHPVRELRRRVARRGVGRSAFARLAGESNAAALSAFEHLGTSILEAHLRLETLLDRALPWEGPAADWVHRFVWPSNADHFDFERSRIEFTPAQAAYLVGTGLARIAAGSFQGFIDDEYPMVLRYWREIVRGNRFPSWENLLQRARSEHENAVASEHAKGCRWDSGLATIDFAGYRVSALSDSYALWHEGLTMRHCIADYAERCVDDGLRVFHLQSLASRSRWTLALEPDSEEEWRVHEMRGPRNQIADAEARALAAAWALAYAGIFPPGENGLASVEDDDSDDDDDDDANDHCPICGAEYCEAHLVATLELDEGLMGGCLYGEWDDRVREIKAALQEALLAEQPNHEWPSEVDSIYAALSKNRKHIVIEDYPGEPDAEWIIDDDAFSDVWCEIDATRLLINYLEEWLNEQPGTIAYRFEYSNAPGLSSSGTTFHANDPEPIRQRFLKQFCVWPAVTLSREVRS